MANVSCDTTYGAYSGRASSRPYENCGHTPCTISSTVPAVSTMNPQNTAACIAPATGSRMILLCPMPIRSRFSTRTPGAFVRSAGPPIRRYEISRLAL